MEFKILMATDTIVETFNTLKDAKITLHNIVKRNDKIVIGFIKQSLGKYVIYYTILNSNHFIDDTIDYIKQWQYENDTYIECIMIPYYDSILTIEISYDY